MILVYEKTFNKWYMAKEKKAWVTLNKGERKKYKVAMRMVEHVDFDGELDFLDLSLYNDRYKLSDICKMVHRDEEIGSESITFALKLCWSILTLFV